MSDKRIYKYTVTPRATTTMPSGAVILSVGQQGDDIVCWAVVNPDAPKVERDISRFPTGGLAPSLRHASFIGTVQRTDGLVFHFFDLGEVGQG